MAMTQYCCNMPGQQDTPAVKSSYSAAVRVPAGLTALMSAVPSDGPPVIKPNTALAFDDSSTETDALTAPEGVPHLPAAPSGTDTKIFYYLQKVPIPSYLIALAVGELESRKLGDRSVQLSVMRHGWLVWSVMYVTAGSKSWRKALT